MAELQMGVVTLLTESRRRPVVLEVFTDAEADCQAMTKLHELLKQALT